MESNERSGTVLMYTVIVWSRVAIQSIEFDSLGSLFAVARHRAKDSAVDIFDCDGMLTEHHCSLRANRQRLNAEQSAAMTDGNATGVAAKFHHRPLLLSPVCSVSSAK